MCFTKISLEGKMQKSLFFTERGMLRLRWWPAIPPALYLTYNAVVLLLVIFGAKGVADPLWHAPLFWLFGH